MRKSEIDAEFTVISDPRPPLDFTPETYGERQEREFNELPWPLRIIVSALTFAALVGLVMGAQWIAHLIFR